MYIYIYIYLYILILIYANLTTNAIIGLLSPQSGSIQQQETF